MVWEEPSHKVVFELLRWVNPFDELKRGIPSVGKNG
jgi:hypothetical protein